MSQANDGLHSNLGRFGQESRDLMAQAGRSEDQAAIAELFQGMTASANCLLSEVETSRQELDRARAQLDQVHSDLARAETLALTDPLTGLPNRRGLDMAVSRELARARRAKSDLCIAIIDIDHFKAIDDQHGHSVGDQALVYLANVILPGIRETDVLGRFGGEEFLLLMPDAPLPGAEFTLNRLLRTLERSPLRLGSASVKMMFSAGLVRWRGDESAQDAIERADQTMYEAEQAGRGRIHVAHEAEQAPAGAPPA